MTNTLVGWIRKGDKKVGCVVARKKVIGRKKVYTFSWSKCLTKPTNCQVMEGVEADTWNKNAALAIATNRLDSEDDRYSLTFSRCCRVSMETDPNIPSIVRKHLRKMAQRARRYFHIR